MESEEMKAARHIVRGQFMNELIFRTWDKMDKGQIKPCSSFKALLYGLWLCILVIIFMFGSLCLFCFILSLFN